MHIETSVRISDDRSGIPSEPSASYQAVEELRETRFWGHYFEVVQILACIEDAHALHDHEDALSKF